MPFIPKKKIKKILEVELSKDRLLVGLWDRKVWLFLGILPITRCEARSALEVSDSAVPMIKI